MMRQTPSLMRHVRASRFSTQVPKAPTPSSSPKPSRPAAPSSSAAPVKSTNTTPSSTSSSSSSSSGGSVVPKLVFFTALSAPAATAVYLKQNPDWNPEILRSNDNWIKFRELVLGPQAKPKDSTKKPTPTPTPTPKSAPKAELADQVVKKTSTPPTPAKVEMKTPEELSELISKAAPVASKPAAPKSEKTVKKQPQQEEEKADEEKPTKPVEQAKAVIKKKEDEPKKPAAPAVVEKKVDEATLKAKQEIAKLADEADPVKLGSKVEKQIQSTTKEILDTLQAESSAAAVEVDKNYLDGIHKLDANALAIRVAQLATEMKHRSKWEAVRLLEALKRMEEDTQKKSAEILRKQDELHKEVLAREVRLQEEVLSRQARDEMAALKKEYADELARVVTEQKNQILTQLKTTFEKDKKAIEDNYARQLAAKSQELQETLATERKQRVAELEHFRAQLRALNQVLDSSSSYEAFSHQVHKTSVAALALSDRIEAAAPLRHEIRALREAARNDPFIETTIKTLPSSVIDDGAASVSQLQERFKTVRTIGRRAALVPEGSGLIGQLFGGALSYLIIPPGGPIQGNDPEAIFSRADYALKAGDIETALVEMKQLTGLPAQVSQYVRGEPINLGLTINCRDWMQAAEARLAVEQTAKVVKAHVALLAASCS